MLKSLRLALTFLWREWRAGEWLIVFLSLFFAVSATTTLHFYTSRLMAGLEQQSSKLLGGDLVISSPTPIPHAWIQKAEALPLNTAEVWIYPSMVSANNQLQLVNIQAVSQHYPLLGDSPLRPELNTIWVEPPLLSLLSIHLSDLVMIGTANFKISRVMTHGLDTLNAGWMMAPRIIMRLEDVPATHTVVPGSRVDYRLLITGKKNQLEAFKSWLTPQLNPGQRLINVRNQQFVLRDILQRTENYFQLALVICLIMSGVAISISIQQYLRRHYSHVALWRCLGIQEKIIMQLFLWQLIIIALTAGLLGIFMGYITQELIANLFKDMLPLPLPPAYWGPSLLGFITSGLILFTFAYPVILQLPHTSPLYIWRNEINKNSFRSNLYFIISLSILLLFVYGLMGFSLLALLMINALLLILGLLYLLSLLLLFSLRLLLKYTQGPIRQGLNQLVRHPENISIQLTGFTLIATLLIILNMTRTHIIESWQHSLPTQTPNYFAFNIAPTDLEGIKELFQRQHASIEKIYPMTRGRLIAVNNIPVMSAVPQESQGNNALHRELNLSWMWEYPADNKIVLGKTWSKEDSGKPLASIEKNLADNLNIHLGDQLTFQIGDKTLSAVVDNMRQLQWTSFHPNFYIIFPPGLLDSFPTTYISSFYLRPNQTTLLNLLIQQFPNITLIDIGNVLEQVQALIAKVGSAIHYLFLFTLAAGVLIFITSLQASIDERRLTYKILRILGASKKYIYKSISVEFSCLASLVILSSVILAKAITYVLLLYI